MILLESDTRPRMHLRTRLHRTVPDALYDNLPSMRGVVIYHGRPWHAVLEQGFGWKVGALAWYGPGESPVAWLPLVRKRRLGRPVSVCLPLSYGVGPVLSPDITSRDLCFSAESAPLEIHAEVEHPDLLGAASLNSTVLDLSTAKDEDDLYRRFHKNHIRRKIRKAEASGVAVTEDFDEPAYRSYDRLQAETRRRQGAPTYPKRFFPALRAHMTEQPLCRLFLARHRGRPVAGVIFLYDGHRAIYGYGASVPDRSLLRLGINQLAMWAAIRDAYRRGAKTVDFGPSRLSQPELTAYKEHWGGRSQPLPFTLSPPLARSGLRDDGALVKCAGAVIRQLPMGAFRALSSPLIKCVL
jgi:hypothetical protein